MCHAVRVGSREGKSNQAKHGLFFDEATELFKAGIDYLEIYDQEHSDEEDRFIAIGSIKQRTPTLRGIQR